LDEWKKYNTTKDIAEIQAIYDNYFSNEGPDSMMEESESD
jgi:hypothetical protein